jgi:hypothetical protein
LLSANGSPEPLSMVIGAQDSAATARLML